MTSISQAERIVALPDTFVSDRLARRKLRHVQERIIEFIRGLDDEHPF